VRSECRARVCMCIQSVPTISDPRCIYRYTHTFVTLDEIHPTVSGRLPGRTDKRTRGRTTNQRSHYPRVPIGTYTARDRIMVRNALGDSEITVEEKSTCVHEYTAMTTRVCENMLIYSTRI
jgi:hypothetical protein